MTNPDARGRDVSFLDHLDRLLTLERAAEEERFATQKNALSRVERQAQGLALADLEATDEAWGLGGRLLVTFASPRDIAGRFDPGALVQLSLRRAQNDEPECRGVISRRFGRGLQVAFDTPPPAFVREGKLWAELLPNDVTYQRARAAIAHVRGMESGRARGRRDVLLGKVAPRFQTTQPLTAPRNRPLNPEQEEAAKRALSADDFFLVHGPPGTGKSTVLLAIAKEAALRGGKLLLTAASNAAVDHLLELSLAHGLRAVRIGHPARVAEALHHSTLDALAEAHPNGVLARQLMDEAYDLLGYARRQRVQGRRRERFANAREAQKEARALLDEARGLERRAVDSILSDAQVVCATCTALLGQDLRDKTFDLVLFDEATQAIEPIALLAFAKAERWILAGDPQQLAPTVLSQQAAAQGLGVSLFERLLADHGDGTKALLREQYRMHDTIMDFASQTMYDGALRAHPSVAARTLADLGDGLAALFAPPFAFLDTAGKGYEEERVGVGALLAESLQNPGEAALVVARVRELLGAGLGAEDIGVIAPYSAQTRLLREMLRDIAGLEVDTVDAFQGREKEAIVLSLTRSNTTGEIGFLSDTRRLNVALTRAKRHVFCVGDSATLGNDPALQRIVQYAEYCSGYRSAWDWPDP